MPPCMLQGKTNLIRRCNVFTPLGDKQNECFTYITTAGPIRRELWSANVGLVEALARATCK